jgi:hypothetical protein
MLGAEFAGRILHGSDLPISIRAVWARWRGFISREGHAKANAEKNPLQRDVIIKQELGFKDETFTLLGQLLRRVD